MHIIADIYRPSIPHFILFLGKSTLAYFTLCLYRDDILFSRERLRGTVDAQAKPLRSVKNAAARLMSHTLCRDPVTTRHAYLHCVQFSSELLSRPLSLRRNWKCIVKPRLYIYDTTGCQAVYKHVYTNIQPAGQPVECLYTRYNRLSNRFLNRFNNRLYRLNGV